MKLLFLLALAFKPVAASDEIATAQALRHYCKACHAIGEFRFIHTEDDDELLQYIRTHSAPSGKPWVTRIIETLDWPTDEPPPFNQPGWMPKGEKRLELAKDPHTRRLILDTLSENLD